MMALYLPIDEVTGPSDADRAADFLELTAFFADDSTARTSELANAASLPAEDHVDLQEEMQEGEEEIVSTAVNRIETRQRALEATYPFRLDFAGDLLKYELDEESFGQAAYILSLVLSNLRAFTPVLDGSDLHPDVQKSGNCESIFSILQPRLWPQKYRAKLGHSVFHVLTDQGSRKTGTDLGEAPRQ